MNGSLQCELNAIDMEKSSQVPEKLMWRPSGEKIGWMEIARIFQYLMDIKWLCLSCVENVDGSTLFRIVHNWGFDDTIARIEAILLLKIIGYPYRFQQTIIMMVYFFVSSTQFKLSRRNSKMNASDFQRMPFIRKCKCKSYGKISGYSKFRSYTFSQT